MSMDKSMKRFFLFPLMVAAFPIVVNAAPHTLRHVASASHEFKMDEPVTFDTSYTTEQARAMTAHAKEEGSRRVAATDSIDEATAISEQARNIRNSLIGGPIFTDGQKVADAPGAKSADDLDKLLRTLDQNFTAGKYTESDAKVLAAELLMAKPFRGIVYRGRNIFETSSGNARLTHAAMVTALRTSAAGLDVYLPTAQWKAGFNYSVEPTYSQQDAGCATEATWSSKCDIRNGTTFQVWVRKEVLPQLVILNRTLNSVRFTKPVYIDNKIFFSDANFVSSKDRFVRMGEAERMAMMSGVEAAMSSLYAINAFQFEGLFESADSLAKVYGFDATFSAQTSTSQDRYNAVRKYPGLFKYKAQDPMAPKFMDAAYKAMKSSLQNAHFAYLALNGHQDDAEMQANLLDPRLVAPFARIINMGFQNSYGAVGISDQGADLGQGDVMSAVVNGEKVTIHMKNFFDNPPASLQDFMPTQFQSGNEWLTKNVDGKPVKYRNYENGRATGWNYAVYSKYFDGANSAADVARISRVLSQSWGGMPLAGALGLVMF